MSKVRNLPMRVQTLPSRVAVPAQGQGGDRYGQGRGGRPWRRKRERVLARDGYLCKCDDCVRLGLLLVAHEVDHIVPMSQGGSDDDSNLRAINRDCHKRKTAREAHGQR